MGAVTGEADAGHGDERVRYRAYRPGPDPLAPPFDTARALRDLGREVFAGKRPHEALRTMLREGAQGVPGLNRLLEQVRAMRRARGELDRAIGLELRELADDPSDTARIRESELASLPEDTAAALRHLMAEPYPWRSAEARRTVESLLQDLWRAAALPAPERIAAMADALSGLLEAEARGERADFAGFMAEHGAFFPEGPRDLDELVEVLARRAAAAQGPEASAESAESAEFAESGRAGPDGLLDLAARQGGLAASLDRLAAALLRRRPDLVRGLTVPTGPDGPGGPAFAEAVGLAADPAWPAGTADTVGAEDLEELEGLLDRAAQGGGLPVDGPARALVERALGPRAAEAVDRLAGIEPRLRAEGLLAGGRSRPGLTPRAVHRLGEAALRGSASARRPRGGGGHGPARGHALRPDAEPIGTAPWEPGTQAPLDAVATVRAAAARRAAAPSSPPPAPLSPEDLRVVEGEDRVAAAVCLLVDLSSSMVRGGLFGPAREAAMALYTLARRRYPQDAVRVAGFDSSARWLSPTDLVAPAGPRVQGSNVQHALRLAREHFARHRGMAPAVVLVTDGEPTAHLGPDGDPEFAWPPRPETAERTRAELDALAAARAAVTLVVPGGGEAARSFAGEVAARGGRVLRIDGRDLGPAVIGAYR
ncbi:vWA domain-containing protein [Nocardiopsis halophila]|uniref:VWA domain-containing protein n=1 Tax=Nocardiopsis halophila TaxID=141692 RepID=UPI0003464254|nr:VWA domain-containing protein [Nocardiopsis halophila]